LPRKCVQVFVVVVFLVGSAMSSAEARSRSSSNSSSKTKHPPQYHQAKRIFLNGVQLFDAGSYNQAIRRFKEALRLYDNPRIHARIALCYRWLGDNLKSLMHYETFLRLGAASGPSVAERRLRAEVQGMVKRLLRRISRLRVTISRPVGAEIRINGRRVGAPPFDREIRLNHGQNNVTIIAKGYYPFRRDVTLKPGEKRALRATLVKHKVRIKVVHHRATPLYKKWWFWTVVGVVVAGTATGLGVGFGYGITPREPSGVPVYHDSFVRR